MGTGNSRSAGAGHQGRWGPGWCAGIRHGDHPRGRWFTGGVAGCFSGGFHGGFDYARFGWAVFSGENGRLAGEVSGDDSFVWASVVERGGTVEGGAGTGGEGAGIGEVGDFYFYSYGGRLC